MRKALLLLAMLWVGCSAPQGQVLTPICGLDPDSGVTLWASARGSDPVVGRSVGCYRADGKLVGVDLKDGRELWQSPPLEGKVFLEGDLLLTLLGSSLTSHDARSPSTARWTATVLSDALPALVDENVLVLRGPHGLSGLDINTGRELWSHDGDFGIAESGYGRVFAARAGGSTLEAFGLIDGKSLWTATVGGAPWSVVVPDERSVAVRTRDSSLEALTSSTGQSLWKQSVPDPDTDLAGAGEGLLALRGSTKTRLLASQNGQEVCALEGSLAHRVQISEGRLFSLTGEPGAYRVMAFDVRTGQQVWARNSSGSTGTFPRLTAGRLIVPFEVRP